MKTCIKPLSIAFALLALAACQPDPDPGSAEMAGSCGADDLTRLIGKPVSAFEARDHAGPVRVIRPGDAVTMDFRSDRLNVMLDDDGVITGLTCS